MILSMPPGVSFGWGQAGRGKVVSKDGHVGGRGKAGGALAQQ